MVMENISALMDGELDDHEAAREWNRLKSNPELRDSWHAFHIVGDALRGDHLLSAGFNEKLSRRLAEEPTVLAPNRLPAKPTRFTTYALSAAASLAAVALVGWMALTPTAPVAPLAKIVPPIPAPAVVDSPQVATVSSDGRMNEYLLAHQGFSPSTAIQGLAPYIRSVSTTRTIDNR
jgi:sigma-E factor negative regulatory protein RseA